MKKIGVSMTILIAVLVSLCFPQGTGMIPSINVVTVGFFADNQQMVLFSDQNGYFYRYVFTSSASFYQSGQTLDQAKALYATLLEAKSEGKTIQVQVCYQTGTTNASVQCFNSVQIIN